jgi:hypothetical protein
VGYFQYIDPWKEEKVTKRMCNSSGP